MSTDKVISKRQERREKIRRQEQSGRLLTIGLITAGALFVVLAFIYPQIKPIVDVVAVTSDERPNADRNNMGDPNAPIHITVFSDFQCPYCEQFFSETAHLLEQYYIETGKAYFTYRSAGNWVSDNIARGTGAPLKTESEDSARAAYCAGDQNKFWEMYDVLFANNRDVEDQGSFSARRLTVIAEKVDGLDVTAWQECFDSGKYDDQTDQDLEDALAANIGGTPYFVVAYTANGEEKTKILNGAQPFNVFQVELEAILSEIGAQ